VCRSPGVVGEVAGETHGGLGHAASLLNAWPGGLPCPWTRGTVDTAPCHQAARGHTRDSPAVVGSGAGLVAGVLAAGGRACQHRPARSLHPGRSGRTRLPPRELLAARLRPLAMNLAAASPGMTAGGELSVESPTHADQRLLACRNERPLPALDTEHFQSAHGQCSSSFQDRSQGLDVIAYGRRQEIDLVLHREHRCVLGEQRERRIAARAVCDGTRGARVEVARPAGSLGADWEARRARVLVQCALCVHRDGASTPAVRNWP
jgi:hypothetical protein